VSIVNRIDARATRGQAQHGASAVAWIFDARQPPLCDES
jgi:hypothetical protein